MGRRPRYEVKPRGLPPTHRDNKGEGKQAKERFPFCRRHLKNDRPTFSITVDDAEQGKLTIELCETCNTPDWIRWYVSNRRRLFELKRPATTADA